MFFRPYFLQLISTLIVASISFSTSADINSSSAFQGVETIVLKDESTVTAAVDHIVTELEQQGFSIPLIINHSAAATSVGLELAPNQVIFARPPKALEKRLLKKSNTMGLDLPMKFLVFEDNDDIKLSVNSIGYLIDRHDLAIKDIVLKLTDKITEQFGKVNAQGHGLISIESSQSIDDTVQAIQDVLSANPEVRIPLVLDYRKQNKYSDRREYNRHNFRRNHNLPPVLIVFGNPNVGTPLMQADPQIGIDLPLEFLVWSDKQSQVYITYNDPHFIAERFNIEDQNARLDAIANVLKNIAQAAADDNL